MWSSDIELVMKNYEGFLGCFPYDKLPKLKGNNKNWSIIINTGKSGTAGEHWVALKRKGDKCFYFDSFGLPIVNKSIVDFVKNSEKVHFSKICIQDISSFKCGMFCIVFIKNVNSASSYYEFINSFDFCDLYLNDNIVNNMFSEINI